jgi:hypothetical protein
MVFFDGFDSFDAISGLDDIELFGLQHMPDHESNRRVIVREDNDRAFFIFFCVIKK